MFSRFRVMTRVKVLVKVSDGNVVKISDMVSVSKM